ncbi:hypothetical protein FA743_19535 [Paracoccus gahaiensis]|uniref:Uncharacterized protein n=1 Tax=Paracoccus gahaiensis TaxID=1706839 RepID=A0A4U0R2H8_9RHOB|nr:hypothetical protein [Paracoccus gahaiensis]TJZ89013.1 hypothetical protein FA743_19535 [Paracoccus gahaiensis]
MTNRNGDSAENGVDAPQASQDADYVAFRYRSYFLSSGLIFIFTALILFLFTAFMLYRLADFGMLIEIPNTYGPENASAIPEISQRDIYNFFGRITSHFLPPFLSLMSGIICATIGIRLLTSSGAVTSYVIAPHDYPVLGPAISSGNEAAVTQFIRLSSLSGATGTFTKMGLTGLPLATIFLTIFLALLGLANAQFFDLAKLTLGAFLGSFVQREASKRSSEN